jgi:hypothetical protein
MLRSACFLSFTVLFYRPLDFTQGYFKKMIIFSHIPIHVWNEYGVLLLFIISISILFYFPPYMFETSMGLIYLFSFYFSCPTHVWNEYGNLFIFIFIILPHTCLKWVWGSIYSHFHYLAPTCLKWVWGSIYCHFIYLAPYMFETSMRIYFIYFSFLLFSPYSFDHVWGKIIKIKTKRFPYLFRTFVRQDNDNENK